MYRGKGISTEAVSIPHGTPRYTWGTETQLWQNKGCDLRNYLCVIYITLTLN